MLILTRRPGESLHLGDNIKITVLGVQGKQIKIGLEVPDDMQVYREEVYLRVLEQNRQAMQSSDQDVLAAANLWQKKKHE
jgi:carbon storage regulator